MFKSLRRNCRATFRIFAWANSRLSGGNAPANAHFHSRGQTAEGVHGSAGVHEAAGRNPHRAHQFAVGVNGDADEYHAIPRQRAAFSQHHGVGVHYGRPVQVDGAGGNGTDDAGAVVVKLQDVAVLQHEDPVRSRAQFPGQLGMGLQMTVLAVDGYKVPGPGEVQHQLQFFLAGVAMDVNRGNSVVQHLGALAQQVIDGLG